MSTYLIVMYVKKNPIRIWVYLKVNCILRTSYMVTEIGFSSLMETFALPDRFGSFGSQRR